MEYILVYIVTHCVCAFLSLLALASSPSLSLGNGVMLLHTSLIYAPATERKRDKGGERTSKKKIRISWALIFLSASNPFIAWGNFLRPLHPPDDDSNYTLVAVSSDFPQSRVVGAVTTTTTTATALTSNDCCCGLCM